MGVHVMDGEEPIFTQRKKEEKMEMARFSFNNHSHVLRCFYQQVPPNA